MFTDEEIAEAKTAFGAIDISKGIDAYTMEHLTKATQCMLHKVDASKGEMWGYIKDAKEHDLEPWIHADSITAWGNTVYYQHALTVGGIRSLNPGDRIEVILLDANVGDYAHGSAKGSMVPVEKACTSAVYIHKHDLTGDLSSDDGDIEEIDWQWEVEIKKLGSEYFWGPLKDMPCPCHPDKEIVVYGDPLTVPNNLRVGWRGPAIEKNVMNANLPPMVRHYDSWWDDYLPWKCLKE